VSDSSLRRKLVQPARRIVVKVGSGVLTRHDGLDTRLIGRLVKEISTWKSQGREAVLVSSGAIASGFKKVGLGKRPRTIREQQACAAIGQAGLIMAYEKAFARHGHVAAQVLLTSDDLIDRRRYLNARNTLSTLLEWKIVPIINENDTVVVDEIKFGDNDTLAGMITDLVEADLFINLTDMDGLFDRDPRQDKEAEFIPLVKSVGPKIEAMAGAIPGALGAGGMYTKVIAARRATRRGVPSVIANGKKMGVLGRILAGEEEGTFFLPKAKPLSGRKHWIAFTAKPRGRLVVDDGAGQAILERGKSLLPSGLLQVEGHFGLGDPVRVTDRRGKLIAVGLTNYSSMELGRIIGCQTGDIENILGYKHSDEVIHRDNMVVGENLKL